jgi:allantoinase
VALDLLIQGGTVVIAKGTRRADVGIAAGKFVEIDAEITTSAVRRIDASGLHLFPGVIDPHVHFNEPGRADWEGISCGSSALAAGGGTLFFDMPLNSSPPVLDARSFDAKLDIAREKSLTDFGFWGGLTPSSLSKMEEMAERGVVGFKAFMCDSGIDEFERADNWTLFEGLKRAAKLRLPVAVHAEDQELVAGGTRRAIADLPHDRAGSWLHSRAALAEIVAIDSALQMAKATGCALHIVHVSTIDAVNVIAQFRKGGTNVSCETCGHYLALTTQDVDRLGTAAKCAPPIRTDENRQCLWQAVAKGEFDFVASDHSPSPPEMKSSGDFFKDWGGIAGVQSTLPILLSGQPALDLPRVAQMTATNAANRFRIANKGAIEIGNDADLCLADLSAPFVLERNALLDRHKASPFVGRQFKATVRSTFLRGQLIYDRGQIVAQPRGQLVRPDP